MKIMTRTEVCANFSEDIYREVIKMEMGEVRNFSTGQCENTRFECIVPLFYYSVTVQIIEEEELALEPKVDPEEELDDGLDM